MKTRSAQTLLLTLVALVIGFAAQANAQLRAVAATPYDRQMTPVRAILQQSSVDSYQCSIAEINESMRSLRAIPYQYSTNWKTPDQVQTEFKADCKAKAIALYSILKKRGGNNIRLVIGMRSKKDPLTHAWLEMSQNGKTYLLDPTFYDRARTIDPVKRSDYVQLYAYEGEKKFRI